MSLAMHKYCVNFPPLWIVKKEERNSLQYPSIVASAINTRGESSWKEITFWFINARLAYITHSS